MDFDVFRKAAILIDKGYVTAEGFGNDRTFWKVGENEIEQRQDKAGHKFICRCTHATVQSVSTPSCTHVIAHIGYMINLKRGRKDEKNQEDSVSR